MHQRRTCPKLENQQYGKQFHLRWIRTALNNRLRIINHQDQRIVSIKRCKRFTIDHDEKSKVQMSSGDISDF